MSFAQDLQSAQHRGIMTSTQQAMEFETDPLSEVLETFPLPIRFAGRIDLAAPWGLSVTRRSAAVLAVRDGRCWLTASANGPATPVVSGDVILLSPACGHELRDMPTSSAVPVERLADFSRVNGHRVLACGGEGARTSFLGGVLQFNGVSVHPLTTFIPPVVHLKKCEAEQAVLLEEIVRLIDRELATGQPGARGIVNRLIEILFVQAARVHLAEVAGARESSMRGMLHPELSTALTLIHRQPEKPWTVAQLAERATMSRSAFSATFAKVLGKPPLQYLRERRMQLACRLLRDPSLGLKEIASRVGYESVSAFSSAFKRFSSMAPGDYRRSEIFSNAR